MENYFNRNEAVFNRKLKFYSENWQREIII